MKVAIIGIHGRMGQIHLNTAREWGAEIVNLDDADVVVVASPDDTHEGYAHHYLALGKAVFCEKPLCSSILDLVHLEEFSSRAPLGCHLPLRQFADEFEIGNDETYLLYDYGRRDKFINSWRNDPDYDLVMGGGIHLMDLWMLKTGCREIEVCWSERKKYNKEAKCPDFFLGAFKPALKPGSHESFLRVDFTKNETHQHVIRYSGREWRNEKSADKTTQLRAFLDMPQTDLLALASHRACLKFQNAQS